MVVKCPRCKTRIRLGTLEHGAKVIHYLCGTCEEVVSIDLIADEDQAASSSHGPVITSRQVLVVDDSPFFLDLSSELLQKNGYSVLTAKDGLEALKIIQEEHPDAIILNLSMPGMSGFEVLRTIRTNPGYKHCKNIPVLVTSGVYKAAEIEMIRDFGTSGFINKEAIQDSLIYRVRKLFSP
ncbi:MAG: hypothetical protein C5B54_00455 [Acidobacteria bacterium]|nr:MAG: hypothetical protein C5B54_00455 [Acidobacteriota bacterium]